MNVNNIAMTGVLGGLQPLFLLIGLPCLVKDDAIGSLGYQVVTLLCLHDGKGVVEKGAMPFRIVSYKERAIVTQGISILACQVHSVEALITPLLNPTAR